MSNTEDEGPGAGFVERLFSGGSWWGPVALAASVGIGAALWKIRKLQEQKSQLQVELGRNHLLVKDGNDLRKYTVTQGLFIQNPFVEKKPEDGEHLVVVKTYFQPEAGKTARLLEELEELWVERQHIYCSYFRSRATRKKLEEDMRNIVSEVSGVELFEKTLRSDRTCGSCLWYLCTGDKRRNGGAMWTLLQEWRNMVGMKVEKDRSTIFQTPLLEGEQLKN